MIVMYDSLTYKKYFLTLKFLFCFKSEKATFFQTNLWTASSKGQEFCNNKKLVFFKFTDYWQLAHSGYYPATKYEKTSAVIGHLDSLSFSQMFWHIKLRRCDSVKKHCTTIFQTRTFCYLLDSAFMRLTWSALTRFSSTRSNFCFT